MSEQDLVRVEVTTTFLANPNQVNDPEWRTRLHGMQQALGALADSSTRVVDVDLSFNGVKEDEYDESRAEADPAVARQQALEIAKAGDAVLGREMTDLLVSGLGAQREKASRVLGGKLKNDGLDTVRAVLAVGSEHMITGREMGKYGRSSMADIRLVFANKGIALPKAPSVENVALFCDDVSQVPGHVLMRVAREAEAKERERQHELAKTGVTVPDTEDIRFWLSDLWTRNLLKRNVADLMQVSIDSLCLIMTDSRYDRLDDEGREWTYAAAQALQRTAQQYAADFAAAKEAHEASESSA
jgi:hypothetical protein